MPEYTKPVPKDTTHCDKTLEIVLDAIIFYTQDGDEFIRYQNNPDKILLTFDGKD